MKRIFPNPFNRNLNAARIVVVGFALIILTGALLLHLPFASRSGESTPFLTCLFTATSATCVTGLILVDTGMHWAPFGQGVILALLQLGGLGFVTLVSLVPFVLRQRIGLSQRLMMATALNLNGMEGVVRVVRHALMGTFLAEGIGALVLATRFIPMFGLGRGLWFSIFHSVSAFCNGGFDLLGPEYGAFTSLEGVRGDPVIMATLMALIVWGGLGFFVWEDLLRRRSWRKLRLYTKLVLGITACLILAGALFFAWVEWDNPETLGAMPVWQRPLNALFQSITLRTAGYASFDQGALTDSGAVMSILLMLIGGSSGSTAGGIKTVTAGILFLTLLSGLRGREQVVVRGRTIPQPKVMDAVTLTLTVGILFLGSSMVLSILEQVPFLQAAFEAASALGTVGVTMGITVSLSAPGALLVILLMYLGRVGILSFAIAFLTRKRAENKITYPTADVMIG